MGEGLITWHCVWECPNTWLSDAHDITVRARITKTVLPKVHVRCMVWFAGVSLKPLLNNPTWNEHEQSEGYSAKIPDIIFRDSLDREIKVSFDFIITETKVKDLRYKKGFHYKEMMIIDVNQVDDETDDDSIFATEFNLDERNGGVYPKKWNVLNLQAD